MRRKRLAVLCTPIGSMNPPRIKRAGNGPASCMARVGRNIRIAIREAGVEDKGNNASRR